MAGGLGVQADLTQLNQQLKEVDKKFAAAVKKNLRLAVSTAGSDLISAMRSEASWSSRIPGATSMAVSFGAKKSSIRIKVDHKKAPHARPLELGNKTTFSEDIINQHGGFKTVNGRRVAVNRNIYKAMKKTGVGVGRVLRHPVWKKGGYAEQPLRPFFFAAVEARTSSIDKKFQAAIDQIATDAGFR